MVQNVPYPGIVDYSDLPLLPPWYIPGWTAQNADTASLVAPPNNVVYSALPEATNYTLVTGNFNDGNGPPLGGYFTFEQSNDLLILDPTQTPTAYYRVPKRLVGNPVAANTVAYNQAGSGKLYLIYGMLYVMLMANDNANITIFEDSDDTNPPEQWIYHVKEYFYRGKEYDIFVPTSTTNLDINSVIIPGTVKKNKDWDRGY